MTLYERFEQMVALAPSLTIEAGPHSRVLCDRSQIAGLEKQFPFLIFAP
jgi:hypothetical protein